VAGGTDSSSSSSVPTVYVSLVDCVSGRVLHRATHFYATMGQGANSNRPAPLRLVENWVVYSYWNTRAQRTEVRGGGRGRPG
jgi:hypothetical protein